MSLTARQLLHRMAQYNGSYTCARRIEGNREVWRTPEGEACGPAVKTLIKRGHLWTHYPTGHGYAGINDAGRAKYDQDTLL